MAIHKRRKRGYYFIIDAILASLLLITGLIILSEYTNKKEVLQESEYFSQDLLTVLSSIKIYELNQTNNSFIVSEINNGSIVNMENSILEQVGEYWARGESDKARTLLEILFSQINVSKNFEIIASNAYRTEYDILYNKTINPVTDVNSITASRRMISGIERGLPLSGYSSTAYLKKISGKRTSSYVYFGGFVGQGEIDVELTLPEDFNSSRLIDAMLKIETIGIFNLSINGIRCGSTYYGNPYGVSVWNIAECNSSFSPGINNITIKFISNFNESYISGGFLKVVYTTNIMTENQPSGYKRYYFPGINGFVNLYDSFSVQGIIRNWTLNITFDSLYNVFLKIGNETIFNVNGKNQTQNIIITQSDLNLAFQTVPLRLSITNLSNITLLNEGKPADSILITDVSGSMNDCSGVYVNQTMCTYEYKSRSWWWWWNTAQCAYNGSCSNNECNIYPIYTTRNYRVVNMSVCLSLLDIAKSADKLFVDSILNESLLHSIGLVDFSNNAAYFPLSNVAASLKSKIDSYNANGGTCTCCGLNYARNMIINSSKNKFIILLSDGEPNYYCDNYNDYTGTSDNSPYTRAIESAINASRLACQNNITVYTIGFGSAMSESGHNIMRQIACNSSLYYDATNASDLLNIYKNITEQILLSANFSSQTVTVIGNFYETKIHPNSYIDIYYDDVSNISLQGKISVKRESEQFNGCSALVYIPEEVTVLDAYVTSYSGPYWTDSLYVNDNIIFNLSQYGNDYSSLGDPFIITVPSLLLNSGAWNNITLKVGDINNFTNCSYNNTLIYDALINVSIPRSQVLQDSNGCLWNIWFEDGQASSIPIPSYYSGVNTCYYNSTNISYNNNDAYDVSVYNILRTLDFDDDGLVDVNLNAEDLEIIVTSIDAVPYLWGPSIIEVRTWR
ncbi:MAG: hypothetical protein KatS3mg002_1107 [Candidatus Woesearchaeota archaeon]|nr:MAG: hypothetical protein KatS3mg002_1107 [Candidatus Woesearchaeota archaeon]